MDAEAMAAASKAVSGPNTPDAISSTSKPDRLLTVAMACAGPVITAALLYSIWLLGRPAKELAEGLARIDALKTVAMGLVICLIIVVLRLASGAFKSGAVRAGPASMDFVTQ
jgi:glycerol uptake facilitator-like aquaporin